MKLKSETLCVFVSCLLCKKCVFLVWLLVWSLFGVNRQINLEICIRCVYQSELFDLLTKDKQDSKAENKAENYEYLRFVVVGDACDSDLMDINVYCLPFMFFFANTKDSLPLLILLLLAFVIFFGGSLWKVKQAIELGQFTNSHKRHKFE